MDILKLIVLSFITVFAAIAANFGQDWAYTIHALIIMAVAFFLFAKTLQTFGDAKPVLATRYQDDVVRAGVIATSFWGVVGMLVGVFIAFQLAFPALNFDLPFTTFGRIRPLHTSAVIFAFGGNALIATSFYIVQR